MMDALVEQDMIKSAPPATGMGSSGIFRLQPNKCFSTRSVDMSLARPFKAGDKRNGVIASRSDAWNWRSIQSSLRDDGIQDAQPGLERPG